jgi:hypothetical protein
MNATQVPEFNRTLERHHDASIFQLTAASTEAREHEASLQSSIDKCQFAAVVNFQTCLAVQGLARFKPLIVASMHPSPGVQQSAVIPKQQWRCCSTWPAVQGHGALWNRGSANYHAAALSWKEGHTHSTEGLCPGIYSFSSIGPISPRVLCINQPYRTSHTLGHVTGRFS